MKKLFIISVLTLVHSLGQTWAFSNNPCASAEAIEKVRSEVYSTYVLRHVLPGRKGMVDWKQFFDKTEKTEKNKVRIVEISMRGRVGEWVYGCSALAELYGERYVVVYTLKKVHSGKKDYYYIEIEDVLPVK